MAKMINLAGLKNTNTLRCESWLRRPRLSSPLRPFCLVMEIYDWSIAEDTCHVRGWRGSLP